MTAERITTTVEQGNSVLGAPDSERLYDGFRRTDWLIEGVLVAENFRLLTERDRADLLKRSASIAAEYGVVARPDPNDSSVAIWFGRATHGQDRSRAIRLAFVMPSEREAEDAPTLANA